MVAKIKKSTGTKQLTGDREAIVNNAPRLHATFDAPIVAHQGDLAFVALKSLPKSAKKRINRQLAEGNTQGSRHVAERGDVYDCDPVELASEIERLYKTKIDPKYLGPVFVSPKSPTENDITHPEHGHQGFPAGTVCAIAYQRSQDREEREAKVRD